MGVEVMCGPHFQACLTKTSCKSRCLLFPWLQLQAGAQGNWEGCVEDDSLSDSLGPGQSPPTWFGLEVSSEYAS